MLRAARARHAGTGTGVGDVPARTAQDLVEVAGRVGRHDQHAGPASARATAVAAAIDVLPTPALAGEEQERRRAAPADPPAGLRFASAGQQRSSAAAGPAAAALRLRQLAIPGPAGTGGERVIPAHPASSARPG